MNVNRGVGRGNPPRGLGLAAICWIAASSMIGCDRDIPPAHEGAPVADDSQAGAPQSQEPQVAETVVAETTLDLPEDAVRLKNVALALIDAGMNADAAAACDKLMRLLPDEPLAVANRGLVELRSNRSDAARALLDRAAKMAPDSAEIVMLLGRVEAARNHADEAADFFRRAMTLDPTDLRASYALHEALELGRSTEAQKQQQQIFESIVETHPDNLLVRLQLLRWYAEDGQSADAADQLAAVRAMDLDVDSQTVTLLSQAAELLEQGNTDGAKRYILGLTNMLKPGEEYQQAVVALKGDASVIGEPLRRFLNTDAHDVVVKSNRDPMRMAVAPLLSGKVRQVNAACFVHVDSSIPPLVALGRNGGISMLRSQAGDGYASTAEIEDSRGEEASSTAMDTLLSIDWNNDGRMDLLAVSGAGAVAVTLQSADGTWSALDPVAQLDMPADAVVDLEPYDIDLDGDLDLLACVRGHALHVLRNARRDDPTAGTTVQPFPAGAGVDGISARAMAIGDVNDDGVADVLMVCGDGAIVAWINRRRGRFERMPVEGCPSPATAIGMADMNNDGRDDIVAIGENGAVGLGRQVAAGRFKWTDVSPFDSAQDNSPKNKSSQLRIADFNIDGFKDVVAVHGGRAVMLRNEDGAALAADPIDTPCEIQSLARPFDADVDGDFDVLLTCDDGHAILLNNESGGDRSWHRVQLESVIEGGSRVNSFGVGTVIEVMAGGFYQKYVAGDAVTLIGMGEAGQADHIHIIWPNGVAQEIILPTANQTIVEVQRLKGSCPFLFTYDGAGFTFVTDLLWRSPLGMMVNAQDVAPVVATEDYVIVRADQLVARDGQYDLRFTSSLWETIFVDELQLICVDHPADVDVFVDERFLAPNPPPHRVYAVDSIQPPTSAMDHRGRDVLDIVAERDGERLAAFALGRYQGVAEDHYVELQAPPHSEGKPLYLLAGGWIFPTDTSINVALSQAGATPPRPLSIEVPDGKGNWRVAIANAGFPAGKNKTIVIDLSDVFDANDRRIRISTNLEVYWDRFAFAAGRPDVEAQMQTVALSPVVADLGYLGFPRLQRDRRSDPSIPIYDDINPVSQWADLQGYHTRYGDVIPLLADTDDRYVIMNAGDEMRLLFDVPPPPPAGWVRDFVFFSDGWVKDGDYNTVASATVGPLPHHHMIAYPYPETETPATLRFDHADWTDYHTRYVTPTAFRERWRPGR